MTLKILETNVLHASDVIYWLDASSAEAVGDMLRIAEPLSLQLTTKPRDLRVVHGPGKTALLRRPSGEMIAGRASEAERQRPPAVTFALSGVVSHARGSYIPRRFSIDAGLGAGHALAVYPSPQASKFGPAGGLLGCLRFADSGQPVPWALLTLQVTSALGATLTFRCQASGTGDFLMPLRRLPPLPEGIDDYAATLAIAALESASADAPLDPDTLVAMELGALDTDDEFLNPIDLTVVPGEIRLLRSSNRDHLAVQPS